MIQRFVRLDRALLRAGIATALAGAFATGLYACGDSTPSADSGDGSAPSGSLDAAPRDGARAGLDATTADDGASLPDGGQPGAADGAIGLDGAIDAPRPFDARPGDAVADGGIADASCLDDAPVPEAAACVKYVPIPCDFDGGAPDADPVLSFAQCELYCIEAGAFYSCSVKDISGGRFVACNSCPILQ